MSALKNLEAKPHLRKNNRIRSIYSSLRIEANSLSIGQVRDVISGQLVLGEQKEIQEVKNAYGAYAQISVINPYDIEELKRIHAIMTKYLVDESGCFRHGEEGVFNGEQCIFMALPARLVPQLIDELFIHPFSDGNGRMARLGHTCLLSKWKSVFQYIPIESQIEKFQDEYYNAIAKCHINGDSNVFIEFMLKQIDKILEEILLRADEQDEHVTEYVKKLLNVMEYEVPYTSTVLMEKLGLKSKETFRKNYMNPAMQLQLVQMTIPEKPKSRNQRYIRR